MESDMKKDVTHDDESAWSTFQKGGWYNPKKDRSSSAASSFVNRTEDWMTLSQVAAGSLGSHRLLLSARPGESSGFTNTPKPTMPPDRYKAKPKSWPMRAWNSYQGLTTILLHCAEELAMCLPRELQWF